MISSSRIAPIIARSGRANRINVQNIWVASLLQFFTIDDHERELVFFIASVRRITFSHLSRANPQPRAEKLSAPNQYRQFCLVTGGICALAFGAIAALNYVVNPYAQYRTQVLPPLVQPSRAEKLSLLTNMSPEPSGLILGSSRVLKLEPNYLEDKTGLRFFNAGVNYGKPEDYLAFLRLYRQHFERAPEMLVVGVDVVAFSDGSPMDARLLGNSKLCGTVPDIIPFEDRFHRWKELLSWQQLKMSAKSMKRELKGEAEESPQESFRDDGLIVYHQRESELAEGTYDFESALDYNRGEYQQLYAGFDSFSLKRCEAFFKLVESCRSDGTRLVVFLTPMHPNLQTHLEASNYDKRRDKVRWFLEYLRDEFDFAYVDLSEVTSFDGEPDHFVDGIHPLEPNTRKMIDRCLAAQRELQSERSQASHAIQ